MVLVALLAAPAAEATGEAKPAVALLPVTILNPQPDSPRLATAMLRGLHYAFGQISSLTPLEPASVEQALKDEKLNPGQTIDNHRAIEVSKRLKADLVVVTALKLRRNEKASLSVRLIEPKSSAVKKRLTAKSPVDGLLGALSSVAVQTTSIMNYRISNDERRALKHPPTPSFHAFADYQRALAAYDPEAGTGNLAEAVALLSSAIKRDPQFAEVRFQLGLLSARQGRSEQAAAHLQRLAKDHPTYPNAQYNLGLAKLNQGDYAAARRHLLKAYQANPRQVNLLNDLALASYYLKDYKAARGLLATASELAPTSAIIWNDLGTVAYAQGAFAKAKQAYTKAIQYNPKSVSSHYNLGLTYLQLAELDKAKEAFEKALELDNRHAKTYFSLAIISESDGTGKAAAYWKKYLELAKADKAEQPFAAIAQRELEALPDLQTPQP